MTRCCRVEYATDLAQRCIDELAFPFDIGGNEVGIGVSIGIVIDSGGQPSIDLILQQAYQAMYKAKQDGRNRHQVFAPGRSNLQ